MACLEVLPGERLFFSKMNMAARLTFVKMVLKKPQDFWNSVRWTGKTKVEMFGPDANCHIWIKP